MDTPSSPEKSSVRMSVVVPVYNGQDRTLGVLRRKQALFLWAVLLKQEPTVIQ